MITKMDELDKNRPDDFWRKAFDEAAETPPLRVWDSIERRLDQSNDTKIIPLWGMGLISSRPLAWGMGVAAAVTLLLIGWWAGTQQATHNLSRSVVQQAKPLPPQATDGGIKSLNPVTSEISKSQSQSSPMVASSQKLSGLSAKSQPATGNLALTPSIVTQTDETLAEQLGKPGQKPTELSDQLAAMTIGRASVTTVTTNEFRPSTSATSSIPASSFSYARSVESTVASAQVIQPVRFEPLTGKSLHFRKLGQIHRIVWFRPEELPLKPEALKSKHQPRDVWASASVMPGAFNPMVSVQTTSVSGNSYASMDALKNTQTNSAVSSHANFSVAYQAGAGVQLTEHWSVESGIGYLSGRSTVETPALLPNASLVAIVARSTTSGTVYGDALRSSMHSGDMLAAQPSYTNVANSAYQQSYTSTRQVLTNDYQYMQVPLQVGYQLRPRKRLSLALLGGLITNIFVRNTVGNEVVVTAKDGVYRPLSLAATMGARFRYRPSPQWSASLAGMYQPSLGLGTQSDSQVLSRPTSAGMSFGVDYHF
ncbi:hypothetical protein [Spirosoma sp. KCTC 42546]|uniref:hypothetical protein n=1 Tax=Spirosoma sp. KCTC 42546 TaxID=2520506 RepID=UPI001FEE0AC0|nr:hypothetical protein [Spirosoma sp. KCTC 42546]